jgi:hypothetical protein
MTGSLIGLAVGLAIGLAQYVALQKVASAMKPQNDAATTKSQDLLRLIAKADLVIFPLLGFFLTPILFPV